MVSLEQVKLLETKVVKAIDAVKRYSEENFLLREKLDGYRKRIDELEVLVQRFKEDQGRIEEGILSALERLNQFEDAIEANVTDAALDSESQDPALREEESSISAEDSDGAAGVSENEGSVAYEAKASDAETASSDAETASGEESDEDILAALEAEETAILSAKNAPASPPGEQGAELDIF